LPTIEQMPAIETADLTKRYGDLLALDGLTFSVDGGELYAVLGPNGSGKTTTIEVLTGQRTPSAGSATVLGYDPVERPLAVRSEVGILPEREDPPSFLTPREYLEFVAEVRAIDARENLIARWAGDLSFEGTLDTLAINLSEGQRQRVMLAAAFLHDPALVFIDEPLVNLDPIMQESVKEMLADYAARGNTLLLSTHYVDVAAELCTRVGIMESGRLVAEVDTEGVDHDELLSVFTEEVATATDGASAASGAAGGTAAADGGVAGRGGTDRGPHAGSER